MNLLLLYLLLLHSGAKAASKISVVISPTSAVVVAGGQQQFTATVSGPRKGVTWSTTGGTISSKGLYTAPSTAETDTVTATSTADPTKSASATVTVTANQQTVSVSIQPTSATVKVGQQQQFTATVTGTMNTAVTWSVTGAGTVSQAGLYSAPATPETDTVTATSQADSTKSASATVAVTKQHSVALTWTESDSSVTSFNVYRGLTSGGETLLQSGILTTSYTDQAVQAGQSYFYEVTAVNSGGESAPSSEIAVTVPTP